jgi:hypothetical protein
MAYNKFSTDLRRINQTFITAIGQMAEHLSGTRRTAAARREAAE